MDLWASDSRTCSARLRSTVLTLLVAPAILATGGCQGSKSTSTVARIIWRAAPSGAQHVSPQHNNGLVWISSTELAGLTVRKDGSRRESAALQVITDSGRTVRRMELGRDSGKYEVVSADTRYQKLAINDAQKLPWTGRFVDIRTGNATSLENGCAFLIGVMGNSQPFDRTGKLALVHKQGTPRGSTYVVDVSTGKRLRRVNGVPTAKGSLIRFNGGDGTIVWFDGNRSAVGGEKRRSNKLPIPFAQYYASMSLDGSMLVVFLSEAGLLHLRLYDTSTGTLLASVERKIPPGDEAASAVWSPDGRYVAIGTTTLNCDVGVGGLCVYILSRSGEVQRVEVPGARIVGFSESIAWSLDGSRLAFVVHPKSLREWEYGYSFGVALAQVR